MLSRSSASSRAIPVERRIKDMLENPFVPEAFGRNQRGMQAADDLDVNDQRMCRAIWKESMRRAAHFANELSKFGVHKQWANRLLEPYSWHTAIITATEWSNFFALRCSPEAQPEIRTIAEMIRESMAESSPTKLKLGDWHLPYIEYDDVERIYCDLPAEDCERNKARVSAARCARVSYLTHDGKRDINADLALADRLEASGHMSPFEHVAFVGGDQHLGFVGNFRNPWVQYRKLIQNEHDFSLLRGTP
jgi:thymidylate synthase ThyX